ncbi:Coiled-coil and C2 domain-containing protein 1A [Branchiostoma belcheri]|nr:Coiled-coil and C2 domain-containing protein 1A [Branchiostoma belcheri]
MEVVLQPPPVFRTEREPRQVYLLLQRSLKDVLGCMMGSRHSAERPNLPSLEVLKFEQKLLERQIQAVKSKGRLVPERSIQVYQEMGQQIIHVQNQLATGGPSVKKAYIRQLEASLTSYHAEAVQWTKQGKKDRAHQALSKKKVVENELMKFRAAAVHTK